MPRNLKSFQRYILKIKITKSRSFSSLLSACKYPRTASFAANRANHHEKKDEAATLYDIDQFLLENFRSLYLDNGDEIHPHQQQQEQQDKVYGIGDENKFNFPSRVYGSRRFFVAIAPSSSLIEEARLSLARCSAKGGRRRSSTSTASRIITICEGDSGDKEDETTSGNNDDSTSGDEDNNYDDKDDDDNNSDDDADEIDYVVDDYSTVKTYSWNPYKDFRRSMEEMIEAKLEEDGKVDWDFMEELLVCYLNLNEKRSLKFIINAFVDLVVSLRHDRGELTSSEKGTSRAGRKSM